MTPDAGGSITGVGEEKLQRFGSAFMKVIREYVDRQCRELDPEQCSRGKPQRDK